MAEAASPTMGEKHPFAFSLPSQTAVMSSMRKSLKSTCITRETKPIFNRFGGPVTIVPNTDAGLFASSCCTEIIKVRFST